MQLQPQQRLSYHIQQQQQEKAGQIRQQQQQLVGLSWGLKLLLLLLVMLTLCQAVSSSSGLQQGAVW
jgi:hypothetical protein